MIECKSLVFSDPQTLCSAFSAVCKSPNGYGRKDYSPNINALACVLQATKLNSIINMPSHASSCIDAVIEQHDRGLTKRHTQATLVANSARRAPSVGPQG